MATSLNALSALSPLDAFGGSAAPAPAPTPAPAPGPTGPAWLTGIVAQVTVILLGLVFVVVGLFSFSQVRNAAGTVAKAAAVAA